MSLVSTYAKPLASLLSDWSSKLGIAFGATLLKAATKLFVQDVTLVLLIVLLLIIDFITGVIASLSRGEKIESGKLRMSIVKALEFGAIITACVAIANSFGILSWLGTTCYLYVALTELYSIGENVSSDAVKGVVRKLKAKLQSQLSDQ